ncbi:uncharacterized protein PFL1_02602 [Pseudozyma flocculosa PF-1]|uniref:Related to MAK21 - protein required for 60S ribosomal subunit biogenesis n=2 Tax=Pseudozyma flocculosa TaxID=84751 RepID=A0A5C3EYC9_9BASI|nr:uncharacterized protein PFL1_02602 [Pseudozyma flocculosa PF-1]EPQ29930.1 hypothetical protein PFL1_02602 [Pseudozyma flocculosa PF-1]SPO37238.1 related to MAK21 - protein required for 60S ribosomal subunit biogenesis [Pseudozyma flocculosa]
MARDFRPKDKKAKAPAAAAPRPASTKPESHPSATQADTNSPAATSSQTKTALKKQKKQQKVQSGGYDSEESVDDETLLREIQGFGGSAEDLELVKKASKGKGKGDEDLDAAGISSEVASFLKQLQSDPSAPEPKVKAKAAAAAATPNGAAKAKETKQKQDKKQQNIASTDVAAGIEAAKKRDAAVSKERPQNKKKAEQRQPELAPQPSGPSLDEPKQNGFKGKRMTFDDDGVAQAASAAKASGSTSLRLEPAPQWYKAILPTLPSTSATETKKSSAEPLTNERIAELLELGTQLMNEENRAYEEITGSETALSSAGGSLGTLSASDARFVRTLLSSEGGGTLSDRISALTLLVQSSPVHNVRAMDSMLNMARKKSREEAGKTTRALADWLAGGGGLSDRKLFYFRDQPQLAAASKSLSSPDAAAQQAARAHLLLWAFEDYLKKYYFTFLQILEVQSQDPIAFVRKQAVTQIFVLLRDKPEQEQNLLRLLVNKLGDSERSVASKTSNHLLELLAAHPAMKLIVVREVANLVLKPSASYTDKDGNVTHSHNAHARYYGVLTLNQTVLTVRDVETANQLILLYFDLFEGVLRESEAASGGREEQRPAEGEEGEEPKKKDKGRWRDGKKGQGKGKPKGKGRGKGKGKAAVTEPKAVVDADAKMMAAILAGVRRAFPFAKVDAEVFEKHIATLFRITHSGTFNICIQALQLIFQLTISNPSPDSGVSLSTTAITDRFYRVLYDSLFDPRLETSSKQAMYLNLLFQALKADQELDRTKAFVKRICQVVSQHQPPFICGCLFLLGRLFQRQPGLRTMLNDPEDDDEENFRDVADSDEEVADEGARGASGKAGGSAAKQAASKGYAGRKRDPRFANAGVSCLWDVVPLLHHFHPSVALHASQLLQSQTITSTADLSLNTLSHFLDRFVYRNPKTKAASRGVSIMQPAAGTAQTGQAVTRSRDHGMDEESYVNDAKFWNRSAEAVPVDQLFFHQFFNLKSKKPDAASRRAGFDDDDEDNVALSDLDEETAGRKKKTSKKEDAGANLEEGLPSSDDESDPEEREIWKAMKASMPGKQDLAGLDDSDVGGDADDDGEDDDDDDDDDEFDYADSEAEREIKGLVEAASDAGSGSDSDDGPQVLEGMEFSDSDEGEGAAAAGDVSDGEDVFEEDEDDLIPFAEFEGSDDDDEEDEDEAAGRRSAKGGKKRGADGETSSSRRKKRKALPMFASAEDYAHMLDSDDEGRP